jgi:protein-tyrosine kinase
MSLIEQAIAAAKARRVEPDRTGRYRELPSAEPVALPVDLDAEPPMPTQEVEPPAPAVHETPFDFSSVRVIATDPAVLRDNRVLIESSARQPAEGAYRMLRTRVMRAMRGRGWRRLGITAAGANEGKTLTALNLAISMAAQRTQPVVLVDLDLRRPKINQYLGIPGDQFAGLSDYLSGEADSIEDLLVSPGIEGLHCILGSRSVDRSSDLLASPRGKAFMTGLARKLPGAMLVFDLPPLLATDDPLVVAPMIDGLLFVVADRISLRSEVASAAKLLQEFNVVGTVLNRSSEPVKAGYYDY